MDNSKDVSGNSFTENERKTFDELSMEEQKARTREAALSDGFSGEDADYFAQRWEKF